MATTQSPLSTGQIARYCGVNFRTVLRWIERGLLPAYRLPGRGDHRVAPQDFLRFLEEHHLPIPRPFEARARRVVVAEDERVMARALKRALESAGFEVQTARSGLEAGLLIAKFRPAVVTLDLHMPGMSGLDVLRLLKEDEDAKHVRVLVVSGLPAAQLDAALHAGADDVLAKPFENAVLIEKVQRLMQAGPVTGRAGSVSDQPSVQAYESLA